MKRKLYEKFYFWVVTVIIFLSAVQILFTIEAPVKWLEAVWSAGDFISFIGTIFLGYIAIHQTQRANIIAESAHKTSLELIKQQKREYMPLIELSDFLGTAKYDINIENEMRGSNITTYEGRTYENDIILGYSIALKTEDNLNKEKTYYVRSYEFNFKYSGKFPIRNFSIKKVVFENYNFRKSYELTETIKMSLGNGDNAKIFLFLASSNDFTNVQNESYQYLKAKNLVFAVEIELFDGTIYEETINIVKHFVIEPEKQFNLPNIEMPISVSYNLTEKVEGDE